MAIRQAPKLKTLRLAARKKYKAAVYAAAEFASKEERYRRSVQSFRDAVAGGWPHKIGAEYLIRRHCRKIRDLARAEFLRAAKLAESL